MKLEMIWLNLAVIILIVFSGLPNCYGQNTRDNNVTLSQIRQVYQQINSFKKYKVITLDNSEDFLGQATDNGGSLKGYFKGDSLKKLVEWVGLSNRVVQNEYYLDKGKLVFVYSTNSRYKINESKGEIDYSTFDKIITGRYYFNKGKLINAILSDKEQEITKQNNASELLLSCNNYIKLLNAKRH